MVFILCDTVLQGTVPKTIFGSVHKYRDIKLDKLSSKFVCTSVIQMLAFPPKYETFTLTPAPR